MQKIIFAICAIASFSMTSAMAQQQGTILRECAQDVRAACGDVAAGGGNIRACLNSHLADLTRPCQVALLGVAALANECRTDVTTMCGGIEPGGGRIEACLQSHFTELSPTCVEVMAQTVGRGQ